jgi:putative ABC transport system permease protein
VSDLSNRLNPKILGIRLSMLLHICGRRLRLHTGQELLAGSGIAVGVALVFGVLVANASLTSSAGDLVRQVVGSARLQIAARSPAGFDQRLANTVANLPGVQASAAVLRENVALVGPHGRQSVQLLGLTPGVITLGSLGTRDFGQGGLRFGDGIVLPSTIAGAIGAQPNTKIAVLAYGAAKEINTGGVLASSLFGALSSSPVAIAPLATAQRLTGLARRVTLILVRPRPGADRLVRSELLRIAGNRLDVVPADNELRLLEEAAKPNDQSTALFSAISVMVGFLLALCAMLLTVPERRRFTADLRMHGYDWRQVLMILGTEALALGAIASAVGVVLGDVLSRTLFHQVPAYLAFAFPIGSQQTVHPAAVVFALGCGVLATLLASLLPVFDLSSSRPRDAVYRTTGSGSESFDSRATLALGGAGVLLLLLVTAMVLIVPSLTIAGGVALALATLCVIPIVFAGAARCLAHLSEHVRSSALLLSARELSAASTRSIALAGIAALAVYGSVAVGGAQHDLLHGLDQAIVQEWDTAEVWVTPSANIFDADSFHTDTPLETIARTPGIASVRAHQGGFLDVGRRRLWIRATPVANSTMILSSQLLEGNLAHATALLRKGGWATVSSGFAGERRLRPGDFFHLPTPSGPVRLGVAAITTNIGWPSGTITINTDDYSRYWETTEPTTLAISLQPGVSPDAGRRAVERALGYQRGLRVLTSSERIAEVRNTVGQGVKSLSQIATLLLIAAALAVASALSAVILQRRPRLASLKIQGYDRGQLWRALLLESAIVLGIGCVVGAVFGVYGHALASRALLLTTGFPAPFSFGSLRIFITLGLVAGIAMAVIAVPGLLAARVPARASFQE